MARSQCRRLERDWEAALAENNQLEAEYQRFRATQPLTLTTAEREAIRAIAADLPAVWNAPTTTSADRKELLRVPISELMFRSITTKAGLGAGWTPRELRHSFVSIMSDNGVPIENIADLVGHASTAVTETGTWPPGC